MILIKEIAQILIERQWSLSVAESCTGGLLSSTFTAIAGASQWFCEGLVVYSVESKINRLGLSLASIITYGAVSENTSVDLARRIREISNSTLGIGITGNAGPGFMDKSSLGDVFISICSPFETKNTYFRFNGYRLQIQDQATHAAISFLYSFLSNLPVKR